MKSSQINEKKRTISSAVLRSTGNSQKFINDVATLRDYGGERLKLSLIKTQLNPDFEFDKKHSAKGTVNDEKLDNNIIRARQKILEYCYCNDFTFFITITLDKTKYDRYDLNKFQTDLTRFCRNQRKKYNCDIQYLLVPERHEDGAWHMHGFLMGLPLVALREFTLTDKKLPTYIRKKLKAGFYIYEWTDYSKKFGFCDLEYIQSRERSAVYVTKYITKALLETSLKVNSHLYYRSRGLKSAEILARGTLHEPISDFDFENQFCKIAWRDNIDLSKNYLLKKFER